MRKHTCKYCKAHTHYIEVCNNCREKIAVWRRIQKFLND